jgi:hypothetical protein
MAAVELDGHLGSVVALATVNEHGVDSDAAIGSGSVGVGGSGECVSNICRCSVENVGDGGCVDLRRQHGKGHCEPF